MTKVHGKNNAHALYLRSKNREDSNMFTSSKKAMQSLIPSRQDNDGPKKSITMRMASKVTTTGDPALPKDVPMILTRENKSILNGSTMASKDQLKTLHKELTDYFNYYKDDLMHNKSNGSIKDQLRTSLYAMGGILQHTIKYGNNLSADDKTEMKLMMVEAFAKSIALGTPPGTKPRGYESAIGPLDQFITNTLQTEKTSTAFRAEMLGYLNEE